MKLHFVCVTWFKFVARARACVYNTWDSSRHDSFSAACRKLVKAIIKQLGAKGTTVIPSADNEAASIDIAELYAKDPVRHLMAPRGCLPAFATLNSRSPPLQLRTLRWNLLRLWLRP